MNRNPTIIPPWLANPDLLAPCFCGDPLIMGQPFVMMEGDTGMKRWAHVTCVYDDMQSEGFEIDPDDED